MLLALRSVAESVASITGAGGVASAEAFGAPSLTWAVIASTGGGAAWRRPDQPRADTDWYIVGAGAVKSAEALGRPSVSMGARARRQRDEELMLMAA